MTIASESITPELWETYRHQLHQFVRQRVNDPAQSEDIVQDVLLKMHLRLDSLNDGDKLMAWMYQITRNAIIDFYRQRPAPEQLPAQLIAPDSIEIQPLQAMAPCIHPFILQLPEKYRHVIVLSEIEGKTHREIAAMTGLSVSGVKSRVQRGRQQLRHLITACCRFEFDHRGSVMDVVRNPSCPSC